MKLWVEYLLNNQQAYLSFMDDLVELQMKASKAVISNLDIDLPASYAAKGEYESYKKLMTSIESERREEESNDNFRQEKG